VTTVGIVGWRGMVGSVLLERMLAENDFQHFEPVFFSTSQAGQAGPDVGKGKNTLQDANDLKALAAVDMIVSCQGGEYTQKIHGDLRGSGYRGLWIDAASTLRMAPQSVIVLDPVNRAAIDQALASGKKDFIGGNCTVSSRWGRFSNAVGSSGSARLLTKRHRALAPRTCGNSSTRWVC